MKKNGAIELTRSLAAIQCMSDVVDGETALGHVTLWGKNDHTREISLFVKPTTMTSLFAQSRDQHDVPSCSIRRAGLGNLTVGDQSFSLVAKKSAHRRQGKQYRLPEVLRPPDLVQRV